MSSHAARVRFSTHVDARNANSSLNGSIHWGVTLATRLAINNFSGRDIAIRDTGVRMRWEAPGRVAYAGYPSMERVGKALDIVNRKYRTTFVSAQLHQGLPQVDKYTVRFQNLPVDTKKEHMEKYARPSDVVWDEPNYKSIDAVVHRIKHLLNDTLALPFLTFDLLPPPYRDGYVQAWVHFATPSLAKAASTNLHRRKPRFTGLSQIYAEHVQSFEYTIPLEEFRKIKLDIIALRGVLSRSANRSTTLSTFETQNSVVVKISACDLRELGHLKAEFEKIRGGEVLRKDWENVWDDFFAYYHGKTYLQSVEKRYPGVLIKPDKPRRRLMLFGPLDKRQAVKKLLLQKYDELRAREERIPLPHHLLTLFLNSELGNLQRALREDTVRLDLWEDQLIVRGTKADVKVAEQAVQKLKQKCRGCSIASCPVCSDDVDAPVSLKCGHTYCRGCLISYFKNAVTEDRFFPLTCLGKDGTCRELVPLSVPREILSLGEFDAVVEAAFLSYIRRRPKEFHYCPSPDCMQVYRSAPRGTVLQCPSCLLRICPECHVEYHEGFECPDKDGGDHRFREWAEAHSVKNCPGCKVPIERSEGCNHVTCTQCQSHICWVCLETFPRGEGIYVHMRVEHGGIGLGPEDFIAEPFM